MTDYAIYSDGRAHFVTMNATTVGGPYYNTGDVSGEQKAKRRIRDLKRKDLQPGHNVPLPPVEKLAMSSAYGNMNLPFALPMSHPVARPRGVYPAVSKQSYKR